MPCELLLKGCPSSMGQDALALAESGLIEQDEQGIVSLRTERFDVLGEHLEERIDHGSRNRGTG